MFIEYGVVWYYVVLIVVVEVVIGVLFVCVCVVEFVDLLM